MLTPLLAVCIMLSANPKAAAKPAAPASAATSKTNDDVIVESSAGATMNEPDPLVVSTDGAAIAPTREQPPVACFKNALRLFGGDRRQALALCRDGTGNLERVKCAEMLTGYLAGAYDDVARACSDGGTVRTGQCVIDSARLLQGSYNNAIALCSHGGGPDNFQCLKQGLIALGGFGDEVIELCRNLRMPFPKS